MRGLAPNLKETLGDADVVAGHDEAGRCYRRPSRSFVLRPRGGARYISVIAR